MQKNWGKALRLDKKKIKNISILFISGCLIVFLAQKNSDQSLTPNTQIKGTTKTNSEAQLKKIVAENTEKYGLKKDWLTNNPQSMPLSSKSSVIVDFDTNELLYADNENEKLFPASITKVLTATIVLENMNVDDTCTISENAANMEPNRITMRAGEKLKVKDLLYGLMMISANDAAEALADCSPGGREEFINKMNLKVKELGLTNSNFVNPSGWHDDNHYTSAFDMASITNYAIKSHPEFMQYFGNKGDYSVFETSENDSHWWSQISTLLKTYPGMDGAKTGFTYEAGNTYIGTAERDGKRIIIVYFAANSTTYDATTMLDQGFYLQSIKN